MRRLHGSIWLLGAVAWIALFGLSSAAAEAHRRATARESKGMWRTVEREDFLSDCVQRRGLISTAPTPRRKYGTVVVADGKCGNGQFVLAKRRGGSGVWRIVGAGSDWGSPDRCADDLKRIPRRVLEDFFGSDYCAGYGTSDRLPLGKADGRVPQLLCLDPAAGHVRPARRPRRCVIDTVLGPTRLDLRKMSWRRWGQTEAVGHGQLFLRDEGFPAIRGEPGLAGGVVVHLRGRAPSAPPPCYGGRWYARATLDIRSGPDRGRRIEQRLTGGCLA